MNANPEELKKFQALAAQWWDPEGDMKPLHEINPLRLEWINQLAPLKGKRVLDIGCGGGVLAESMAKAGAIVTGIDLAEGLIKTAKLHCLESNIEIDYQCISAEELATQQPAEFDIVTCMEMLEHVPEPSSIIKSCAELVKPGGKVFFSTLNRNMKSYLFSIIGAEYILKLLPIGTHDYKQFIRPAELESWARHAGLQAKQMKGISYRPIQKRYYLTDDISVNYLMCCEILSSRT